MYWYLAILGMVSLLQTIFVTILGVFYLVCFRYVLGLVQIEFYLWGSFMYQLLVHHLTFDVHLSLIVIIHFLSCGLCVVGLAVVAVSMKFSTCFVMCSRSFVCCSVTSLLVFETNNF